MFELHPQLARDTVVVGCLELCQVLLSRDSRYPWCILVPERENIQEIYQLEQRDKALLMDESCLLSELMTNLFAPDKMNVAALGNVVPQLHLHHVARFHNDQAWPAPIWGVGEAKQYTDEGLSERVEVLRTSLSMLKGQGLS